MGNEATPRLNAGTEEPNVTTVVKLDTSMQAVCRSKPQKPHKVNAVSHQSRDEYTLFQLTNSDTPSQAPLEVTVSPEGHNLTMEVDTGASYSLISKQIFNHYCKDHDLHQSNVNLTYSGECYGVFRKFSVDV